MKIEEAKRAVEICEELQDCNRILNALDEKGLLVCFEMQIRHEGNLEVLKTPDDLNDQIIETIKDFYRHQAILVELFSNRKSFYKFVRVLKGGLYELFMYLCR